MAIKQSGSRGRALQGSLLRLTDVAQHSKAQRMTAAEPAPDSGSSSSSSNSSKRVTGGGKGKGKGAGEGKGR